MNILLTESQYKRLVKKSLTEQNNDADSLNKVLPACKAVYNQNTLNQAISWWKNRISNENFQAKLLYNKFGKTFTTQKWNQKYGSMSSVEKKESDQYAKLIGKLIFDIERRLNEIKLSYYYKLNDGSAANVYIDKPTIINVNCSAIKSLTKEIAVNILIHEIQHCIDEFLGTESNFINGMLPKPFNVKKINPVQIQYPKQEKESDFDIGAEGRYHSDDILFTKDFLRKDPDFSNVTYNCRPTEVASRMAQVRQLLKLSVSEDLTITHLRWDKEAYNMFRRNLLCWAARNDNVSLEDFISNLNLLAKNKTTGKDSNMV